MENLSLEILETIYKPYRFGYGMFAENGGNIAVIEIIKRIALIQQSLINITVDGRCGEVDRTEHWNSNIPSVWGMANENGFNRTIDSIKIIFDSIRERLEALESNRPPPMSCNLKQNIPCVWDVMAKECGVNECIDDLRDKIESHFRDIDKIEAFKNNREQQCQKDINSLNGLLSSSSNS